MSGYPQWKMGVSGNNVEISRRGYTKLTPAQLAEHGIVINHDNPPMVIQVECASPDDASAVATKLRETIGY
jgi:hypothetical protein